MADVLNGKAYPESNNERVGEILQQMEEREAIQGETQEPAAPTYIDSAAAFLSVVDPEPDWLIDELLPAGVIGLLHGEPRTRKSWLSLDIAIAVATGTPVCGLARFGCQPRRVLYSSQEDGAALVRARAKALLKGRGIEGHPDGLLFAVHKAIDLDNPQWQSRLLIDLVANGVELLILDPIRRYSMAADKGPSDVQRITAYLRRVVTLTGATVLIVHHDVKPPAQGKDERRRAHRASGGDWFAAAECPISLETAGETRTLAYPTAYKTTTDPAPWSYAVESDNPRRPTTAKLAGQDETAEQAADLAVQEQVLAYLADGKQRPTRDIERGCRMRNGGAKETLDRLMDTGRVDSLPQGKGKATLWWIRAN